MTTSTATPTPNNLASASGLFLLPWTSRGLEGLWLLAVFLVPLTFLNHDYAISEAQIAYVEVPKVALLRFLAGATVILWSVEWAIKDRSVEDSFPSDSRAISRESLQLFAAKLNPLNLARAVSSWLNVHPTRWLFLAAVMFFGSTLISTVLSASFINSMWGEVPGQDGYSAYTIASYAVLFGVIATHVKSPSQLQHLLGAVVMMGLLVGLYGALQHYGHDFLGTTEITGGGSARVTIFMGNTIFASAVLSMTIPFTFMVATLNFRNEDWGNWEPMSRLNQLTRDTVLTSLWSMILAVQLLGIMFTFSRGPWSGTVVALAVFLGLIVLTFGWRLLIRAGLLLGLAGIFSAAFLHWQGSVSIIESGPWFGFFIVLVGLAGTYGILFVIKHYSRSFTFIGLVGATVAIIGIFAFGPSALSDRGANQSVDAGAASGTTAVLIGERISSIKTEALGGFTGGRGTHWKVSWELIKNRPWFDFDSLSLPWLRSFIGYGPDLFRFTYLLESPVEGSRLSPLEPDHAHNFFIHQTVEQGILGGIASLALFASVFGVICQRLITQRTAGNPIYRLLLIGLTAVIIGRFLEMMVGVARISDLTVLWVILGLYASLLFFDDDKQASAVSEAKNAPRPAARTSNRRERRLAARASAAPSYGKGMIFRLAIVAWLIGGVGVVTWQKSINSVRASVAEGRALSHFREGDLESSLHDLNKAIELAPGIPNYYYNRAQIYFNYLIQPDVFTEPVCDQQNETPYLVCLGVESLESNLESISQQPFYYRSRIAAGNSASTLNVHESAIESYTNAAAMVPSAWQIRNNLAESMIALGIYADAVTVLDSSLEITGDSTHSTVALYLKGRALEMLGQRSDALATLNQGLSLDYTSSSAQSSLDLIREIDVSSNVAQILIRYDRIIDGNPQDAVAYYFRGLAHLERGDSNAAKLDIEKSFGLGLKLTETLANRAYARFQDGHRAGETTGDLVKAVSVAPDNALFNAYLGEYRIEEGEYLIGLEHMARATMLDENLGMALLGSSRAYMLQIGEHQTLSSGTIELMELAKEFLDSAIDLDLPTPSHYVERGIIHAFFSEFELAYSDFEKAIEINPDLADTYFARAKTTANRGDFQLALVDLNTAIQLNPENGAYFRDRYVVYQLLGDLDLSETDFATARGLGWGGTRLTNKGVPHLLDTSYFFEYQIPKLTLEESDIATYRSVLELIPNDWQIRNNLAEELIELGNYNQAIAELDISLETTGVLAQSSRALELKEAAISLLE